MLIFLQFFERTLSALPQTLVFCESRNGTIRVQTAQDGSPRRRVFTHIGAKFMEYIALNTTSSILRRVQRVSLSSGLLSDFNSTSLICHVMGLPMPALHTYRPLGTLSHTPLCTFLLHNVDNRDLMLSQQLAPIWEWTFSP